jgi:hypothetical protein
VTARAAIASGALLPDIGRTAKDGGKQGSDGPRDDGPWVLGLGLGTSDHQTDWTGLLGEREKGSKRWWTGGTRAVLGASSKMLGQTFGVGKGCRWRVGDGEA